MKVYDYLYRNWERDKHFGRQTNNNLQMDPDFAFLCR